MATNPPSDPRQTPLTVIQLPTWKLITTAVVVITALAGLGAGYLKLSLNSTEANLKGAISSAVAPLNERTVVFKMVLADLINNRDLSPEMKKFYTDTLSKMSSSEVRSSFEPPNSDKRSLNTLEANREVTRTGKIDGLKWDGDHYAQIRFFDSNDPKVDFSRVDLTSDPPSPCNSRVVDLPEVKDAVVQVCEAHLNKGLEVIVVRKASGSTF
jgi:hypothetical protein